MSDNSHTTPRIRRNNKVRDDKSWIKSMQGTQIESTPKAQPASNTGHGTGADAETPTEAEKGTEERTGHNNGEEDDSDDSDGFGHEDLDEIAESDYDSDDDNEIGLKNERGQGQRRKYKSRPIKKKLFMRRKSTFQNKTSNGLRGHLSRQPFVKKASAGAEDEGKDGAEDEDEGEDKDGDGDGDGDRAEDEGKGKGEGEGKGEDGDRAEDEDKDGGEVEGKGKGKGNKKNTSVNNNTDPRVISYLTWKWLVEHSDKINRYNDSQSNLSLESTKIIDECIKDINVDSNVEYIQQALSKLANCKQFLNTYKKQDNETLKGGTRKKCFKTKTYKNHKNKKNKTKKINKTNKTNKTKKINKIKYNVKYMSKRHSRKMRNSKRRIRQRGGVFGAAQYNANLYGSNITQQEHHLVNGALYPDKEGISFATAQQGGTRRKRGGSLGFVGANIAPATLFATNMFYGKNRRQKTKRRKSNRRRR